MTTIKIPSDYRCLVVEDSEARNEIFRRWLPEAVIATNPADALDHLKSDRFDVVFLDHDYHGLMFVDKSDPEYLNRTFWAVAQKLHRIGFIGQVIVHSGNPIGAKRMADLLSESADVFVSPFGSFTVEVFDERSTQKESV